jgi:hypothetical protein
MYTFLMQFRESRRRILVGERSGLANLSEVGVGRDSPLFNFLPLRWVNLPQYQSAV